MPVVVLLAVIAFFAIRGLRRRQRGEIVDAAEVGPVGWVEGINWRVLGPLARAENRALVRHPAFLVGVALTPLMLYAALGQEDRWLQLSNGIALALVPLGWMTIVAANLLTLRSRRKGADELLAAAPAPQPVRTNAFLASAAVPVVAAALFAVAAVAYLDATREHLVGSPLVNEIAPGILIVAGAVTVGVAVARWLPHFGFGVLAVFAVILLQTPVGETAGPIWNSAEAHPARFLAFLAGPTSAGVPELEWRPAGWHLVYLAGLVLLMVVVALAREGMAMRPSVVLGVAVAVIVGAGWAQLRPPPDSELAAMKSYLTEPRKHQFCTRDDLTTYCAFREQRDRMDEWASRVAAVRALVPQEVAARPLEVTDRVHTLVGASDCGPQPFVKAVHPELVRSVRLSDIWPDDGHVHPGTNRFPCGGREVDELFTAIQIGSWAVGLPPNPRGDDIRCSAAGQSRAVVALWLAAAGIDSAERTMREILDEYSRGPITFASWDSPPMLGAVIHADDMRLALALLDRPASEVKKVVHAEWSTLTSPKTPSAALADEFDLEERGAPLDRRTFACK